MKSITCLQDGRDFYVTEQPLTDLAIAWSRKWSASKELVRHDHDIAGAAAARQLFCEQMFREGFFPVFA